MTIWQISPPAAMTDSITEFYLRYGVALLWPGDPGRWHPHRYGHNYAQSDWIKWFAETMSVGDAILLRTSPARICAVGLVVDEYSYEDRFDDVHGFDLQHCRRVRWCRLAQEYDFGEQVFMLGRFSCVRNVSVREYCRNFLASPPTHWQEAALPELPAGESPLPPEEVPVGLQGIIAQALDLESLYWHRQNFGNLPTEYELIAHFVVPLLRALGWPPERIAIEWRHIDIAVFDTLPRLPEHCRFLIEAKRLGVGVEDALEQAMGYVANLDVSCDIVVTDGIRYRMYSCENGFAPVAYTNLIRLKESAVNLFDRMKTT